jgi:hypothetical protein
MLIETFTGVLIGGLAGAMFGLIMWNVTSKSRLQKTQQQARPLTHPQPK